MKSLLLSLLAANCVCGGVLGLLSLAAPPEQDAALAPLNAPTIRLLSESLAVVEIREPEDRAPAPSTPAQAAEPTVCRAFGPFPDRTAADALQAELASEGVAATVVETADPSRAQLVYVGPVESASRAAEIRTELLARDVDCHVIRSGPLTHALSVGVFRRADLAARQSERVAALGYPTRIAPWGEAAYRVITSESGDSDAPNCDPIAPPQRFL
jgi:hypothetical protein